LPRIIIPSPLRKYTNDHREVQIDGHSLKQAMDGLLHRYPGFKEVRNDSALLSIFVNSKLIRINIKEWDTLSLNNDDEITLIVPIAGG
jgi:molybdopterin converting factor small subunit